MSEHFRGKTLVIQPYPGIGDMLWHLPQLRSIASSVDSGKISVLTKSRTMAKQWLMADPIIDTIYYCEKDEILNAAKVMRRENFQNSVVLHGSFTYGVIPFLAGIKNRYGYGFKAQKICLNHKPYLESSLALTHALELGEIYMDRLFGNSVVNNREVVVNQSILEAVRKNFKHHRGARICFGVGASDAFKRWPKEFFAELAIALQADQPSAEIFLLGSPGEQEEIKAISEKIRALNGESIPVYTLSISEVFAFIKDAALFVGNDSGLMNAAACLGIPTLGLFGRTRPLHYVQNLFPITPVTSNSDNVQSEMKQILPQQVMEKYAEIKSLIDLGSKKS